MKAAAAAAARAERRSQILEAVLLDLSEGVIVCRLDHRILMYNRSAVWFVDAPGDLGVGRSLFEFLERDAVESTLSDLTARHDAARSAGALSDAIVCTTAGGAKLRGHVALVRGSTGSPRGYVLSIHDREGEATAESAARELPPRPVFHDFDLLREHRPRRDLADTPLGDLAYVVFDTETTGLRPSEGDEIVSIAGVRVVNGRVLRGETFERLVDPGFPIPSASIRFHGVTDDMVAGQPNILDVLRDFRRFVGDAVLVAHNAAFDMKFLSLKEEAAGVAFDGPVLDTLLLSAHLDDHLPEHGLDAIARRFGIDIEGRHSALGDAIATATVFIHLVELLQSRGVRTLGEAIARSESLTEITRRQAEF